MLKLISKTNCDRCTKIKNFLNTNQIDFQEIQATEADLEVYRQMLTDNDRPLGFPILLKDSQIINGQSEDIISWLQSQYPKTQGIYFWAH